MNRFENHVLLDFAFTHTEAYPGKDNILSGYFIVESIYPFYLFKGRTRFLFDISVIDHLHKKGSYRSTTITKNAEFEEDPTPRAPLNGLRKNLHSSFYWTSNRTIVLISSSLHNSLAWL